jgi:hypothetical protein
MSNKHIFDYLDYFVDLPSAPQYAVMLTGPWGIGKTYNIKRYLETLDARGKKAVYVSLYGAASLDDITSSILAALLPIPDKRFARIGGQLARVLTTKLLRGGEPAALAANWIVDGVASVMVFDDLERSKLSVVEVFGVLNSFIEHDGRRIIVIGNENELAKDDNYRRIREKVIGMTFELVEQSRDALEHLIARADHEVDREFLRTQKETILEIFAQSKTQNLRILDQSLRSWQRVYAVIDPALNNKARGIAAAFKLFLALSLELRAGRITRGDLSDRLEQITIGSMSKREKKGGIGSPMSDAQDRHGQIYLHDEILSGELLIQVLCDGKIDAASINASLSADQRFVETDEPNWRKVWHGYCTDAEEFAAAFESMEEEFANRVHHEPGIVLHVLSLRLWAAEIGHLVRTQNEVVSECKAYIDDLRLTGRLSKYRPESLRHGAYGLGFMGQEKLEFRELHAYFVNQSECSFKDTWSELSQSLLEDISGDGSKFAERVGWTASGSKPDCADDPILSAALPKLFVDRLVASHPEAQRNVLEGLENRYSAGRLQTSLRLERQWILDVNDELQRRLPSLPPVRRYSLAVDIRRLVGPAMESAKSEDGPAIDSLPPQIPRPQ